MRHFCSVFLSTKACVLFTQDSVISCGIFINAYRILIYLGPGDRFKYLILNLIFEYYFVHNASSSFSRKSPYHYKYGELTLTFPQVKNFHFKS